MTFEKHVSLRQAERLTGICRHTLRLWLEHDLGLTFPRISRGSKFLILERDLEMVLRRREGHLQQPNASRNGGRHRRVRGLLSSGRAHGLSRPLRKGTVATSR